MLLVNAMIVVQVARRLGGVGDLDRRLDVHSALWYTERLLWRDPQKHNSGHHFPFPVHIGAFAMCVRFALS